LPPALNGPAQALGQGTREGILAAFEDANRAAGEWPEA
jgi:ABC-type branched-subunit amino acid transport system substrate-binding protein